MLNLDLFDHNRIENGYIDNAISEIKSILKNVQNERENMIEKNNELNEFEMYEKKKIFLDNISRRGNDLAWIMDENSICISESGDGGPISISSVMLPSDFKVGQVYEKIDGAYVYSQDLTEKLSKVM